MLNGMGENAESNPAIDAPMLIPQTMNLPKVFNMQLDVVIAQ